LATGLHWLPEEHDWRSRLKALESCTGEEAWDAGVSLANHRLDFLRTNVLDSVFHKVLRDSLPSRLTSRPIRLAMLGSCTLAHLHSAIRVAGLRRGIWISTYESEYGQHLQELSDPRSGLYAFAPDVILVALDGHHLAAGFHPNMGPAEFESAFEALRGRIAQTWALAREAFSCPIIHQTPLPVHPQILGNNEHRLLASRNSVIERLNADLRKMADEAGVELLSLDKRVLVDGLPYWYDVGLWHRAKQEICPSAAPLYGDMVGRLLAARQGRSFKCLVLDLDNTLWGGVIGDDGLQGLVLGQGSALGEAFAAFQQYVRDLSRRGIILAVCSKNDEGTALEAFESHPEMILQRGDIACFVANWENKAANICFIAKNLNIGLDSMVFVDDNPAERELVRRELPMVAVPEISDDPSEYPQLLSSAGYFEGTSLTEEDKDRARQYQNNNAREQLKMASIDMPSYLSSLEMRLIWRRFDEVALQRIVQLINKTNQFNLTTRRYTAEELLVLMGDSREVGLQLRLIDRFGDNGIIAIVIGRLISDGGFLIDTWLMSCRVLGREVESATLNLIVAEARRLGATRVFGEYIRTKKNEMVKEHYSKLGFSLEVGGEERAAYSLDLRTFQPVDTFVQMQEG
jgi:FkbH-like protein